MPNQPDIPPSSADSPRWNSSTKLAVTLILIALLAAFLVRFRAMLGPLVLAFMLAYLFYPLATWLDRHTPFSWRGSVNALYLVLVLGLLALLFWGSLVLVQQVNSLIRLLQNSLTYLPDSLMAWLSQPYDLGPFHLDFSGFDINALVQQALGMVQGLLGQVGVFVSAVAGSALQILAWMAFVLLVSYFILLDSDGLRDSILRIEIPQYQQDLQRFRSKLASIWNAFLRGQMLIFLASMLIYMVVLTVLGVRESILLALLAGLARFIPYVGPAIVWTTLGLVSYFQSFKFLGLSPWGYTLLVVGLAVVIDQIFDSLISPRVMGRALRVHPAGVLVAALVGADLFGLLGIVLAAPLLATFKLMFAYIYRKLFDLPPWDSDEMDSRDKEPLIPWRDWLKRWHVRRVKPRMEKK